MDKNTKIKPDIKPLKIILSSLVGLVVVLALIETFTSEPDGGFKNSPTPADPESGFELIFIAVLVYGQLLLHYFFTFKHWVVVSLIYYTSLIFLLLAALVVSFMASF